MLYLCFLLLLFPALEQNMAHLTYKMHSMVVIPCLHLSGRSNSCFQTVRNSHICCVSVKKLCLYPQLIFAHCFLSVALIEPVPSKEEVKEYLNKNVNSTLLRGLTEVCKHKPFNPCVSLQYIFKQ